MQTKNIIQSSANIIRITQLHKGDVYKRIEESSYGDPTVKYGVVMDILNQGDKGFIEALEYTKSYSTIDASLKIFGGDKDIAIFPTTIEEVKNHLNSAVESIRKSIEDKRQALEKEIKMLGEVETFVSGETAKKLTEASFETVSQDQFDQISAPSSL